MMLRSRRLRIPVLALAAIAAAVPVLIVSALSILPSAPSQGTSAVTDLSLASSQARFTVRRLEGDVTGDCVVRIDDDQVEANHYLATIGSLRYARQYDVNLPRADGVIDLHDLQFVVARNGSTCANPIPPQPPLGLTAPTPSGNVTLTKDPSVANIWICRPGTLSCGSGTPSAIGPQDWQNGVVISEVLTLGDAGIRVMRYQFELKYDPTVFQPPQIQGLNVLPTPFSCSQVTPAPGDVVFRCASAAADSSAVTWVGPKTIAKVTLILQAGALSNIRPAKENGIVTDVFDLNEIGVVSTTTPTALPGTVTPPSKTPSVTAVASGTPPIVTPSPPSTVTAIVTRTPPPTTGTPEMTSSPESTQTGVVTRTPVPTTSTVTSAATTAQSGTVTVLAPTDVPTRISLFAGATAAHATPTPKLVPERGLPFTGQPDPMRARLGWLVIVIGFVGGATLLFIVRHYALATRRD